MEPGHDFRLALGNVERCAIGFGNAGNQVDKKQW